MDRRFGWGWSTIGAVAVLAVAAAGCKDSGLPGRNTPLAVADTAGWTYPAYDMHTEPAVHVWNHDWMIAAPALRIPADRLVEVARDGDREVFALVTDAEPYSRLYLREQGTYGATYAPLARVTAKPH